MADMWIRITDQVSADPALDVGLTKRGDVITIKDDGWNWSPFEQSNINHVLLGVEGTVLDLSGYLTPEPFPEPYYPTKPRASYFDVDALQSALFGETSIPFASKAQIQKRFREVFGERMPLDAALSYQVMKPPTPAPGAF